MKNRWLLLGVMLLVVMWLTTGCGIAQEQYYAVVAERDSSQAELQSLQTEVNSTKSELQSAQNELNAVKNELNTVKLELQSVKSKLSTAQSTIQAQEQTMVKAKTFVEVISTILVPALTGEIVNEVKLLFQWKDKIKATEDAKLNRLFTAIIDSQSGDQEVRDFLIYVFTELPRMLE